MPIETQLTFTSDTTLITATGVLLAGLAAAAGTAILVPAIARNILPKPKETHLADFLPFEALDRDGRTVLLKDGSFARYYIIGGLDQSFMDIQEGLTTAKKRMNFLDSLSEINVVARIFTIRSKMPIDNSDNFPNQVAADIASKWNEKFKSAFRTTNIIALSGKSITRLDEAEQSMMSTLASFDVYNLTQDPATNPARQTIGEFLGSQVSPASRPNPTKTGDNLADVLAGDIVWFRPDGIVEFTSGQKKKNMLSPSVSRESVMT